MSVCVSHFKTPTICLHHLAWTSADYFSSATLPARGEACRAGSCRKPKMKNIENLKEQLPVHDDQALLQRGHHVPGQVPPLLLTHMGNAPVDAVRKKQPAILKKIFTKKKPVRKVYALRVGDDVGEYEVNLTPSGGWRVRAVHSILHVIGGIAEH